MDSFSSMFAHDFVAHAYLAGTFIAATGGLVGYFVVLRNQVFVADAQSHAAFSGALAALAFGVDASVGLFAATVVGSMTMGGLGGRSSRGRDVAIGTTFAWILGLGVLFLSLYTTSQSTANGTAGVTVLFGSIFGLSAARAALAAAIAVVSGGVMLVLARPLLFASVAPDIAAARGVPVRGIGVLFMALVGITVGEAVQAIGALLVFGLMVTPGLTAHLLTARPYFGMLVATAVSVGALWAGLALSYAFPQLPPSFVVVALAFGVYVAVVLGRGIRRTARHPAAIDHAAPGMRAA